MPVDYWKARHFVYEKGTLAERAIFAYLFEDGSIERVHQCLKCYKNPDDGFGHGFEHDIRYPGSHPLALEFMLGVLAYTDIPTGDLLDGAVEWLLDNQAEDGSLINPPELTQYPYAPWWDAGGQTIPASITGNLIQLTDAEEDLFTLSHEWVEKNLTVDKIRGEQWLFMMYHAYDYFMNVASFPGVQMYRDVTLDHTIELAENVDARQHYTLLMFAPGPDSPLYERAPQLVDRILDSLIKQQRDDGSWVDQHDILHWSPWWTIVVLLAMVRYRRLTLP